MRIDIQLVNNEHHTWYHDSVMDLDGDPRRFSSRDLPTQARDFLRLKGKEGSQLFERNYPLASILWWTERKDYS